MKLPKMSAVLAAAVLAPAVLFPSSASAAAADAPQPAGVSGPDTASDKPDEGDQEQRDRAEVQRILADKETGRGVREAGEKALKGGAAELRHFLEVELPGQRVIDNRVATFRILGTGGPAVKAAANAALRGSDADVVKFLKEGQFTARAQDDRAEIQAILADKESGRGVREAGEKALQGGAAELRHFLEVELPGQQVVDNRVKVAQIISVATGRAVRDAARAALRGSDADVVKFLKEGQFTARAEDEDRAKAQAILADKESGRGVREAGEKALQGGAADVRHFLEVELPGQRVIDNRVATFRILGTGGPAVKAAANAALRGSDADVVKFLKEGQFTARAQDDRAEIQAILADKESGRGVREAGEKALQGGAAELRHFLEVELPGQRADDNRVKVSQIVDKGGPAVKAAAKAALKGSDADIEKFLKEGWARARAQDEADAAREPAQDRTPGPKPDEKPVTQPETGQGKGVQPAAVTATTGTAPAGAVRPGQLAATGTDGFGWEAGGAAAAVAAGAALVAVSRRRRSSES